MEEQMQWYEKYRSDPHSLHFMASRITSEQEPFGYCQLFKVNDIKRTAEFGIVIGDRTRVHPGTGIKLGVTFMKIIFSIIGIKTLFANAHPLNEVPNSFFGKFVGSEIVEYDPEYGKPNETLYRTTAVQFSVLEQRLSKKGRKWIDIFNIQRNESMRFDDE
jgi:hypothetical protein